MKTNNITYDNGQLTLLDQTQLPQKTAYVTVTTYEETAQAIEQMIIRGAPLIGITAAYGVVLGARQYTFGDFYTYMHQVLSRLEHTRPTAINLKWALNRMENVITSDAQETIRLLEREAAAIYEEDIAINRRIGEALLPLIKEGTSFITHCNPGALATSAYGTATAPFYLAHEANINFKVYSDETRPRLQGTLTAYELQNAGIDVTTITDSTAATLLSSGKIKAVIVGCDRVTANGDVINKIGTLPLAICAQYYNVPFYVAAPTPTFDSTILDSAKVPIEEREDTEVTHIQDYALTIQDIQVYNPAFDITPAKLITGLATEHGLIKADRKSIKQIVNLKETTK
ncbi:S-methyl-5-thioribose-1-phosphate isomerase [Macrococcoides caseolyticum subsp. hominis]|uniref:S-methyl-5-thioribose-1-phosphate isomerase n=1 Tax=Macrococcoides caseolyticum TaxID=69966 RepID=UPI000C16050B|nr:S-methyl-5-thioribose-1-phosphate isomerase [Macrococcus caseolyticus]RAI79216.1 S-methyl-5-thioribose-1-phosphate isomerase [Macrococcus caseolyticus subsp. hominis]